MQAVIIAAGKSTRTLPLTENKHKALLPLLNKPMLAHTLDYLAKIKEITSVVIVVGYNKQDIMETFGLEFDGLKITYVIQKQQLGTGHALSVCEPFIKGDFLCIYGDDIYSPDDVNKLVKHKNAALVKEVKFPERFGIFTMKNGIAVSLEEKPDKPKSNLANVGVYKFETEIFDYLKKIKPSARNELELPDAIKMLMEKKEFNLEKVSEYWISVGYPWDLLNAKEFFLKTNLFGDSDIDSSAEIKDSCVGDNCMIGKNVKIHNSIIMDNAIIGSDCEISDSIIGDSCVLEQGVKIVSDGKGKNVFSLVKGKMLDTGRTKLGVILGDDVTIGHNTIFCPGIKISCKKKIAPEKHVKEDM
jgi:glucose-1-phosphate thymidylyltransferase long form